jgi:SIR2-like protein
VPNFVLLTGAGFSKNWGGFVAREITNALMSRLQNNPHLLGALNRANFEDVLSQVQSEYLATRTTENQNRLNAMQEALSDVFRRMNVHFASRQFEFSNDVAHSIQKFLVRFDAIFTLNQDLLIEVHYNNQNVALWHGTRWQGYELPGLRELPLEDPLAGRVRSKWVPQDHFAQTPNMQPYFKLHGSTAWSAADGSSLMVMGRNKVGLIRSNAILRWNYERFEEYLGRPDTRLMAIGYGFADDHINATIVNAHQQGHLRLMYLVHPSGKVVLDRYPTATIRVPQPIMEIPCIECAAPLSAAFSTDHMAQSLLEGIFV